MFENVLYMTVLYCILCVCVFCLGLFFVNANVSFPTSDGDAMCVVYEYNMVSYGAFQCGSVS